MKKLALLAILPLIVGGAVAGESVVFNAIPSQSDPGLVSYTADLVGGYVLGDIDWDGFATPIHTGTYGSELQLDISGPLGDTTFDLGTGGSYVGGANFAGVDSYFANLGDPIGTWTFDFYETYDDGSDDLPDATWDNITFNFNDYVAPEPPDALAVDLPYNAAQNIAAMDDILWFSFEASAGPMDIWTEEAGADPIDDTEIGLYDALGNLVANNDDGGPGGGYYSGLMDQTLDAGMYYLAVGGFNTLFADGWDVDGGTRTGDFMLHITPEPASLLLLAIGALALRRR